MQSIRFDRNHHREGAPGGARPEIARSPTDSIRAASTSDAATHGGFDCGVLTVRPARDADRAVARTTRAARRSLAVAVLIAAGFGVPGCQAGYFMMGKEPKKKVGAEFGKLEGKTSAIVVWCDQATLDQDPNARFRVADAVRYYLSRGIKKARFVNVREITDFQEQSGSDWEGLTNAELGRRFKADYVIRIDLIEYTTRARDAREVRKGRVRATVTVYDVERPSAERPVYATEVTGTYPQDAKTDILNASDLDILNGALRAFGEKVAQKFYEHEEAY